MVCTKLIQSKYALAILACLMVREAAADVTYGGISLGYSDSEYKDQVQTNSFQGSPFTLQGQIGYFFNDYIALEGRYGFSPKRSDGTSFDNMSSGLLKLNLPARGGRLSIYAIGGWSVVSVDQENVSSYTESAPSFGLGTHYALDKDTALTIEYFNAVRTDRLRLTSLNVTYQVRF